MLSRLHLLQSQTRNIMYRWIKPVLLTVSVSVLSCRPAQVAAYPADVSYGENALDFNSTYPFADFDPIIVKRQNGAPLRILSLGASIMSGVGSSSGDGSVYP